MSEEPREYLIKKGSYFYRPDCAGYTSFKFDAGRYTKEMAEAEASIEPWHMQAIHQNDVPDASDPDKFVALLTAERDRLREAIIKACDLLMERTKGNPARSPNHNARVILEEAIGHFNGRPL